MHQLLKERDVTVDGVLIFESICSIRSGPLPAASWKVNYIQIILNGLKGAGITKNLSD